MQVAFIGPNRELISFLIDGKRVYYYDRVWKKGLQVYPLSMPLINKLKRGGMNLKMYAALILDANKDENLKEYQSCKTEEDIVQMIRKDCVSKGLLEIKNEFS